MFKDIKKFFRYLQEQEGKELRNRIIAYTIFGFVLLIFNRFILLNFSLEGNFHIYRALSKILIENNINPYRTDIISVVRNAFPLNFDQNSLSDFIYQFPVFHLFIYYPFSLIKDAMWSAALWMEFNQFIVIIAVGVFINLFKWNINKREKYILTAVSLLFYFVLDNILALNTASLQLAALLLSMYYSEKNEMIKSGLFFAFLFISPFAAIGPVAVMMALFITRKSYSAITWSVITIILLSLAGFVVQTDWVLQFLRNVIIEKPTYPFINFGSAFQNAWGEMNFPIILNLVPLFSVIWITLEWIRTPKNTLSHELWLLSLAVTTNPFIFIDTENYTAIYLLQVFIFIHYLWKTRSQGFFNVIIYFLSLAASIIYPLINRFFLINTNYYLNYYQINFINCLFLMIMLYWVRWWILRDYNPTEEI